MWSALVPVSALKHIGGDCFQLSLSNSTCTATSRLARPTIILVNMVSYPRIKYPPTGFGHIKKLLLRLIPGLTRRTEWTCLSSESGRGFTSASPSPF